MNKIKEFALKYWYIILSIILIILFVLWMSDSVESKRIAILNQARAELVTASWETQINKENLVKSVTELLKLNDCI